MLLFLGRTRKMISNIDWSRFLSEFTYIFFELIFLFFTISFLVSLAQIFISQKRIEGWLNRPNKVISAVLGACIGLVTPFCSCSTIPVFVGLMKSRAPFAGAVSFLLTSPVLNPAIITLMAAFFGLKATVLYTLFTFAFAVSIGLLLDALGFKRYVYDVTVTGGKTSSEAWHSFTGTFREKFWHAVVLAFGDSLGLLKKVFPYLLFGALVGGFIHEALPMDIVEKFAGVSAWSAIPLAALVGIPLYIRTETMIPIASILYGAGVGPGALIALIIGGAGASIPEVALLNSIFKKQMLIAFLLSVFSVACVTGYLFNYFSF